MNEKTYLGDSVYVEVINGTLLLTTNNGYPDDPRNTIFLESSTYDNLVLFVEKLRAQAAGEM